MPATGDPPIWGIKQTPLLPGWIEPDLWLSSQISRLQQQIDELKKQVAELQKGAT